MVEGDDRPPLGERALRGSARGLAELAATSTLAHRVAFLAQQDRAGRAGVDTDEPIDDERQHLVEIQRRGEDVRDLEERRDLAQLPVRFALEAAFLDDSRDLIRDRLQEIDLLAAEVALLDRLHVHHPDDLVAGEYGHGEHRGEALLVDLRHPLPARLTTYIAGGQGNTRVRDPADDPLSYPQRRAPDAPAVQPVRGDEAQQSVGPLEEIQR